MTAFNLPPGVSLADIERLFADADEEQCLDTEVEEKLAEVPMTAEQLAAIWAEFSIKHAKGEMNHE